MTKEIYLAGGCFWGTEKYLAEIPGVLQTEVGYANGYTKNPTYEEVCSGETGYAETVRVVYDSNMIRLSYLLTLFLQSINPLSKNRQGNDVGEQYRSGIYYIDTNDEPMIREVMEGLQKRVDGVVQIEVAPLTSYFTAEQYHQKYLYRNPGGYCHIPSGLLQKASQMRDPESKYYPQEQDKLKKTLTKQQYEVAFQSATESPFANEYHDHWEQGIYVDITTGEPLFRSEDKFDAGCGWPSFSKPMDFGRVMNILDESHGMKRVEVRSKNGDIHLGHVFDDGPEDSGGLRYCMNSSSLRFIPKSRMRQEGYGDYE